MNPVHRAPGGWEPRTRGKTQTGRELPESHGRGGRRIGRWSARGVGPPGQGVGAWMRVSRTGVMAVFKDMDRAGGIADFTGILVQPAPAGWLDDGGIPCSVWLFLVRVLTAGRPGSPWARARSGAARARGAGRDRRVAISCASRGPGIRCIGGLCRLTGLNSSKSNTYGTRLAQAIIVRRPARVGWYLQQLFPGLYGFHIGRRGRAAPDGGRRIGRAAAGQLPHPRAQGRAQDAHLPHHPLGRGASQQRPGVGGRPRPGRRRVAHSTDPPVRTRRGKGRTAGAGARVSGGVRGRGLSRHRQTGRRGGARWQRGELWGDRADATGTAAGAVAGIGAPARPRNQWFAADRQKEKRAQGAAGPIPRARNRQNLSGTGQGAMAGQSQGAGPAAAQIPAARWRAPRARDGQGRSGWHALNHAGESRSAHSRTGRSGIRSRIQPARSDHQNRANAPDPGASLARRPPDRR